MTDRERLAAALVDLCFEYGYRQTTVAMLLERSGVDEGTFRRLFTDLENCFCEVYGELQEDLMEQVFAAVIRESTWRDRLRAAVYALADYVAEDEKRTQFTIVEVRSAGDRALFMLGRSYERLFDLIDMGRNEGPRRGTMSRVTAEALGGTITFQMYAAYEPGSIESVRSRVPELMYLTVVRYLGAEAAEEELSLSPDRGRVAHRPA